MKINGWLRAAIVIFILWTIGISTYMWIDLVDTARNSAKSAQWFCIEDNKKQTVKTDCWDVYQKEFIEAKKNALESWWVVPVAIFAPVLIILILWVVSFTILWIFYWIMTGFSKSGRPILLKKSFALSGIIILSFVSFLVITQLHESMKKRAFEKDVAMCKLDIIKSKIDLEQSEKYIGECMTAKGNVFNASQYCYGSFVTSNYYCYD